MTKPTLQKVTAADGTTVTVVTRVRDGVLVIEVYRDKRAPALMVGEFTAASEGR